LMAARGHEVVALVRTGSEHKLPAACTPVVGDALDGFGDRTASTLDDVLAADAWAREHVRSSAAREAAAR